MDGRNPNLPSLGLSLPSFPAQNSQQRMGSSGRNKVALKPGRSLMDWVRLGQSGKDLTGVGGRSIEVTADELANHNTKNDAWICIKGKVFNVTAYLEYHPGGEDELMRGIGKDATELFSEVHAWVNYESMLQKCFVGRLKKDTKFKVPGPLRSPSKQSTAANAQTPPALSLPRTNNFLQEGRLEFEEYRLLSRQIVSHDTLLLEFHNAGGRLSNIPLGHHLYLKAHIQGMDVVRPYTPVVPSIITTATSQTETPRKGSPGLVHLMVKVYPQGTVSRYIGSLHQGQTIRLSQPDGDFAESRLRDCRRLVLLAAGTGITPMIGLLHCVLSLHPNSEREITLIFFNKREEDILWKRHFEGIAADPKFRFQLVNCLSEADEAWSGDRGRINKELLGRHLPPALDRTLICVCGPTAFTTLATQILQDLGVPDSSVHAFR